MRRFLQFVREVMLELGAFVAVAGYHLLVSAVIATIVINNFQLDSYVSLKIKIGLAAVMFGVLTILPPIIMFCGLGKTNKNEIPLDRGDRSW